MKHLYDKEDIMTYKTDEISIGTTVIIKTKWDTFKGKLTLNNKDCIAIDYPKELKGTYISRDSTESIRVLNNFFDFYKKIKRGDILERQWISVNDKLPTTSGRFEVTIKSCNNKRHVEMCNFNKDSEIYVWGDRWNQVRVIAWRERDEPYLK